MSNLKLSMRGKGQSIFEMVVTSVHKSSRSLITYPFSSISKQVFYVFQNQQLSMLCCLAVINLWLFYTYFLKLIFRMIYFTE